MEQPRDHLYLWSGMLLYAASGHRNDWHSHYAASLIIALDAPFRLELRAGSGEPVDATVQACLLAPNAENRVQIPGRFISLLADVDSAMFEPLAPLLEGALWAPLDAAHLRPAQARLKRLSDTAPDGDTARELVEDCIEIIAGQRPRPLAVTLDRRIVRVLKQIRETLPREPDAGQLAAAVGLSRSRLLHLFKEQLGLPIGQYLLWRRLFEAARLWDEGLSITDAAHQAGFYDQSHYTRTMRRMLDITPSAVTRNNRLHIHHCWRQEAASG